MGVGAATGAVLVAGYARTPQNVRTYAEFMADVGSIKNRPAPWKDIFFEHVHKLPGS